MSNKVGGKKKTAGKKGAGASKPDEKGEEQKSNVFPLKGGELAKKAAEGDADALKALEKIVVCFERWRKALADQRDVNRNAKEIEGAAQASFENAVEEGLPTTPTDEDVLKKLQAVENAWQKQKEETVRASEMRQKAAERVKKRGGELERAAHDGAQLTIPGIE